jgi:DNA-binding NarL/FixJ family response regulator
VGQGGSSARKPFDVLVVCRPEVLRAGIARMLADDPQLSVTAAESLPPGGHRAADVAVVCDRGLSDPAAVCSQLLDGRAQAVVVVAARADVDLMLECVAAGASAIVAEADSRRDLQAAVEAALRGEDFVAPSPLSLLLDWHRHRRRSRPERARSRDLELLRLLASGRTTTEIATRLGVSPKTVRNRSSLLYRDLGVRSRAQAVRVAEERGLLD